MNNVRPEYKDQYIDFKQHFQAKKFVLVLTYVQMFMALCKEGKQKIEIRNRQIRASNYNGFLGIMYLHILCVIEAINFIRQLYFNLNTGNQQLYLSKQIKAKKLVPT